MKTSLSMLAVLTLMAAFANAAIYNATNNGAISANGTWDTDSNPTLDTNNDHTWKTGSNALTPLDGESYGGLTIIQNGGRIGTDNNTHVVNTFNRLRMLDGGQIKSDNGNMIITANDFRLASGNGEILFARNAERTVAVTAPINGAMTLQLRNTGTAVKTFSILAGSNLDEFEGVFRALPQNGNADADMVLKLGVVDTDLTSLFSVELGVSGSLGGGKLDVGSLDHTFGSLTLGTNVMAAGTYDELSDFTAEQQAYLIGWDEGNTSITVIPEPATLGLVAAFGAGALFVRRRFMI